MATLTHDTERLGRSRSGQVGLMFAVLSAMSFGLSGTLGKALIESGWTPGAAVTARIGLAALLMVVPGLVVLGGRWRLLRENARFLLAYGLVGVAVPQLAFFSAVERMQVGVALLIEFTAPAVVVVWLWLRHGQRPGLLTAAGGLTAGLGLVLVLDLLSGADLDPVGVAWALLAMLGLVAYFLMPGHQPDRLPPVVLAAGGLLVGGTALVLAGLTGVLEMGWGTDPVSFQDVEVPWWVPVAGLALVTCCLAYVFGIAAIRALGSRLASFAALVEVLFGLLFAWLLLGELPRPVQVAGGIAIVVGVVLVKLGEPRTTVVTEIS